MEEQQPKPEEIPLQEVRKKSENLVQAVGETIIDINVSEEEKFLGESLQHQEPTLQGQDQQEGLKSEIIKLKEELIKRDDLLKQRDDLLKQRDDLLKQRDVKEISLKEELKHTHKKLQESNVKEISLKQELKQKNKKLQKFNVNINEITKLKENSNQIFENVQQSILRENLLKKQLQQSFYLLKQRDVLLKENNAKEITLKKQLKQRDNLLKQSDDKEITLKQQLKQSDEKEITLKQQLKQSDEKEIILKLQLKQRDDKEIILKQQLKQRDEIVKQSDEKLQESNVKLKQFDEKLQESNEKLKQSDDKEIILKSQLKQKDNLLKQSKANDMEKLKDQLEQKDKKVKQYKKKNTRLMKASFLCGSIFLIITLGYVCYTYSKKPAQIQQPKGFNETIYPSLHSIDEVRISQETIYYNNIKLNDSKILLIIKHNISQDNNTSLTLKNSYGHLNDVHHSSKDTTGLIIKTTKSRKVWSHVKFYSIGYNTNYSQWFTPNHTHNKGAVYDTLLANIPFLTKIPTQNQYVNIQNRIQTEVGVTYVVIDASGNQAEEEFNLQISQKHRELNRLWLTYFSCVVIMVFELFFIQFMLMLLSGPITIQSLKNREKVKEIISLKAIIFLGGIIYEFIEIFKDFLYIVQYPHTSMKNIIFLISAFLSNIMLFVYFLLQADEVSLESFKQQLLGTKAEGLSKNTSRKRYRVFMASIIHLGIYYQESFELGYTWTKIQFAFPVISLFSMVQAIGKASTSENGEYSRKQLILSLTLQTAILFIPVYFIWSCFVPTQHILDQGLRNPKLLPPNWLLQCFYSLTLVLLIVCFYLSGKYYDTTQKLKRFILEKLGLMKNSVQLLKTHYENSNQYGEKGMSNEKIKKELKEGWKQDDNHKEIKGISEILDEKFEKKLQQLRSKINDDEAEKNNETKQKSEEQEKKDIFEFEFIKLVIEFFDIIDAEEQDKNAFDFLESTIDWLSSDDKYNYEYERKLVEFMNYQLKKMDLTTEELFPNLEKYENVINEYGEYKVRELEKQHGKKRRFYHIMKSQVQKLEDEKKEDMDFLKNNKPYVIEMHYKSLREFLNFDNFGFLPNV